MVDQRYENGAHSEGRSPSAGVTHSPDRRVGGGGYRGRDPPAGRIYIGNLPNRADRHMVEELFRRFGRITEISIKRTISGSPFAFVEFEDPRDAQDAIQERDGYKMDGSILRVEIPFASRGGGRGGNNNNNNNNNRGHPRRAEFRVVIKGLPPSGSWQDLKDHMREAGDCVYADVFRDGTGVVEFARREDMEYALRRLSDSKFTSHEGEQSRITVTKDHGGDYDRRSPDHGRGRPRSVGSWDGGHRGGHGGGRRSSDRSGYDDDSYRHRHSYRGYDSRGAYDGRGRASYSRGRRSDSYDHRRDDRSPSRSRSYRGHH